MIIVLIVSPFYEWSEFPFHLLHVSQNAKHFELLLCLKCFKNKPSSPYFTLDVLTGNSGKEGRKPLIEMNN